MDELLRFLEKYEIWVYVLLGVVAVIYVQRLLVAWRDWRNSVFGLEKESAQRKLTTALTILVLLALFVIGEFFIVSFVAPTAPQTILSTPTLDLLATVTATLPSSNDLATPTASGLSATEAPLSEGCVQGQIEWTAPLPGDTITSSVELKGTVNVPNLGFFKYQYAQPGSDTWTDIAAGNKPLINGTIGVWNTSQLVAGDYKLRLVVMDNQNKLFPACVVQIRIVNK
jgi:hypothetical protein